MRRDSGLLPVKQENRRWGNRLNVNSHLIQRLDPRRRIIGTSAKPWAKSDLRPNRQPAIFQNQLRRPILILAGILQRLDWKEVRMKVDVHRDFTPQFLSSFSCPRAIHQFSPQATGDGQSNNFPQLAAGPIEWEIQRGEPPLWSRAG